MSDDRIFCAEQIDVPQQLPAILKEYTKEVIRNQVSKGIIIVKYKKIKIFIFCLSPLI